MNDLRAASVQFQHRPSDKTANIEKIRHFVARAADQQAEAATARPSPISPEPSGTVTATQAGPPTTTVEQRPTTEQEPGCLSLLLPWNWFK